jgi:hypothetical protein
MATQIKDAELRALLKNVEDEIGAALKGEAGKLSKADGEPDGDETPPPEGSADGGEAPAASPPPPAAEGSAEDPGASSAAPGGAPGEASPGAAPGGDPAADGGGDMEALKGEYMKLGQEDPEALKAHYLACVEALQAVMGGQGGAPGGDPAGAGGAPPAGPEASAPGGAPPPPAMKNELASTAPKGKIGTGTDRLAAVSTKKAELPGPPSGEDPTKKNEAKLQAEITDLRKGQELLLGAVDKLLGSPLRKAVTGIHSMGDGKGGTKTFTRDEAKAALSAKITTGALKKSDRERAIAFSRPSSRPSKPATTTRLPAPSSRARRSRPRTCRRSCRS